MTEPEFDARKLTWAALLGRWLEFARSAVALPDDAEGEAMRQAVPDIISLQALAMALGEADELGDDELALAIDRARVLLERHVAKLGDLFGEQMHPMLVELLEDASEAMRRAEQLLARRRGSADGGGG